MDFKAFDRTKLEEYARKAKDSWGQTEEYREYEQRSAGRTREEERRAGEGLMELLAAFGGMQGEDPASEGPRALAAKLQAYISENFYTCSDEVLRSLGGMYAAGGSMTENIDRAGGPGTAEFARRAIEAYCDARTGN